MKSKSLVTKRSVVIAGQKTSVSLEEPFMSGLKEIAAKRSRTLTEVVSEVDKQRQNSNLSSALRVFVLDFYRSKDSELETSEETVRTYGNGPDRSPSALA